MKKLLLKIGPALAAFVFVAASAGAGAASTGGWHQPEVPARLMKD